MGVPDWVSYGSFHPSHARVIGSAIDEPYGFALVDTNGDGREIAFELFERQGSGWELIDSRDDVSGGPDSGWSYPDVVWAYGRGAPGSTVLVHHHRARHETTVDDTGWWVFVRHVENAGEGDVPFLV